jgi:glycogen operon protein
VVFNHTCEGNELGPILSFKGLENHVYYHIANGGSRYSNYSGCGNTVNGNHPIVREMIFNCLRHWVHNYHVDGFRFDLASILSRNRAGDLVPNPPLVEMIAEDPMLADTKIIAEAWDAAGAYQVGSFSDHLRWAEWNGRYRDDVRRFWRGDAGTLGALATRLAGSSDLYMRTGRPPSCSINFITSHDGYTLNDLVTYKDKHNEANGEGNRDGENNNLSDNYGVEGPTRRKAIRELRSRQIRNMLSSLLLSQGVPMIVAGDECRRTQQGNNNAYCQDNPISWFDWRRVKQNADLLRFVKTLIHFRRSQATVRRKRYLTGHTNRHNGLPDVAWFAPQGQEINWGSAQLALICLLSAPDIADDPDGVARDMILLFNSTPDPCEFQFPKVARNKRWRMFVNTANAPPKDIFPKLDGPAPPASQRVTLTYRSFVAYVSQ